MADDGEAGHSLLPKGQNGAENLMRGPVISGQVKLADTGVRRSWSNINRDQSEANEHSYSLFKRHLSV